MKSYIDADKLLDPVFTERERRETKMEEVCEHLHNFYEMYFLIDGNIDYFVESRTYHLKPFDILLIRPHTLHKSILCKDYRHERVVLYFDRRSVGKDILNAVEKISGMISLPNESAASVFKMLNCLLSDNTDDEWHNAYQSSLVTEILITIIRGYKPGDENYAGVKFNKIIDYVKENCTEQLSLKEVAARFYISDAHLSRLFRRYTGFTFTRYINYQRIIISHSLLQNDDMSISDIAAKCGFENLTHFGRVFKQLTGYSPREYKKNFNHTDLRP